jgi:phenylpyruvate tautomerase PptA (4-oxalocrotonate tautomerase family)
MPTYACSIASGRLTPAQKMDIVHCVATVHHEETGAPRYFVQVIFYEVASGNHYIAGELASPEQIWIRGDLRSGRTEEQKAQILRRILQGVAKSIDASGGGGVGLSLGHSPDQHCRIRPHLAASGWRERLVRDAARSFEGEAGATRLAAAAPTEAYQWLYFAELIGGKRRGARRLPRRL